MHFLAVQPPTILRFTRKQEWTDS